MTFASGLDFIAAAERMAERGAAFVPGALDRRFVARLRREAGRMPLYARPEEVGPVRQRMDGIFLHLPYDSYPALAELAAELELRMRQTGVRGLRTWRPNEAAVQRYRPGSVGITPHLDQGRYRRMVAVFTLAGRARFQILRSREGGVLEDWVPGPGDLVLLRGPGVRGLRDGRPFHGVDAPKRGERWSLSFRMRA